MGQVTRDNKDALNITLNVKIESADYLDKFKTEMEKHRSKSHMKGFRKGKTPIGLIKKMYGKAVMADAVNDAIQRTLFNFLETENIKYLGQPLPAEGEQIEEFDYNNPKDYELKFEVGLQPEYTIIGADSSNTYTKLKIQIPESEIDTEMENLRKRAGQNQPVEEPIMAKDLVKIQAEELEDGKSKDNGWASTFSILVDEHLNPSFSDDLIGKKKGDALTFKVSEIEKDRDEAYVRKYILNVEEADKDTVIGDHFMGEVIEVGRISPAELNQEFFDKVFGEGKVSSEQEARAEMKNRLSEYYDNSSDQLLYRDVQKNIMDSTPMDMPAAFLERWLAVANEKTAEEAKNEYKTFAKGLSWTLIRRDLVEKFELKVAEEELLEGFKARVRQYFGGYGDELVILNTANRLMEDQKQVESMYQELVTNKLFKRLGEEVTLKEEQISKEDFEKKIKAAQESDNADLAPTSEEVVEEVE